MRYHAIIHMLPRLLRADEACDYVGGPTMLRELNVAPTAQRKGLTVYDRQDLDRAIEKLKLDEAKKEEAKKQEVVA